MVVPSYNHESFVAEALESVLAQSYPQTEILVSDDGSVDQTPEVIKSFAQKYPGKVIPILSPQNRGIAANMNNSLAVARGEYVALLAGDDLMLPTKLEKQVALLSSRPQAVGCLHDAEVFLSSPRQSLGPFSVWANGWNGFDEGGVELWFRPSYRMLPSTFMYRRRAVPPHGFDSRLRFTNDWLFDVEVFRNGKVAVINEVLGAYRRHSSNVTSSTPLLQAAMEENLMALSIVEARYPELSGLVRLRRQSALLGAALRAAKAGHYRNCAVFVNAATNAGGVLGILHTVAKRLSIQLRRRGYRGDNNAS